MKKILIIMTALALLLMPFTVYPQSDQKSAGVPPISQALVPEGDFALKLAAALQLGAPNDEAQAEDMLTSAGIAPKNGWIADYPVTPNIIGELQNSVATAADSKKLPMGKADALRAFQGLTTELVLAVSPGSAGEYTENQPQPDGSVINNYYYEEGPPVVSYYPPPWDYDYLYAWVPYPFWCSGFFFPGFFILNDFDTFVFVGHHHHHVRITNHFFDPRTHTFGRVDPVSHSWTNSSRTTAFNSTANRNAASSIFKRSMNRTTFSRGTTGNHVSSFSTAHGRQGVATNNRGNTIGGRTFSNSRSFATGGTNHGMSGSFSRSFNAPSSRGSFSSGRSFSGFSGGHSFGGFSSSHASGGFSGGHSFGGFSGGHGGGFSGGHGGGGGRR
jgi:hypothetical protein